MTRPFGLKVIGGLLIIGGFVGAASAAIGWFAPDILRGIGSDLERLASRPAIQEVLERQGENPQSLQRQTADLNVKAEELKTEFASSGLQTFLAVMFVTSLLLLTLGICLLKRKSWARWWTLLTSVLLGVATLIDVLVDGRPAAIEEWCLLATILAWSMFVAWYLFRPSVKAQFQKLVVNQ